jgi:hypothetical protein
MTALWDNPHSLSEEETQRRLDAQLLVVTRHYNTTVRQSISEIASWFLGVFGERIVYVGFHLYENPAHYETDWLPRTREQAVLLKLRFG